MKGVAHIPLSPILVVGLARPSETGEPWVWRLLDHAAPDRLRLVLVSEAMTGGEPEALRRWHCARPDAGIGAIRVGPELLARPTRLQVARRIHPDGGRQTIPLLPYWLDEDIPPEGLDIIRVPGPPASFERTLAGLMRLLWEVVREVGRLQPQERRSVA